MGMGVWGFGVLGIRLGYEDWGMGLWGFRL